MKITKLICMFIILGALKVSAQDYKITVKGTVQFPDPEKKVLIVRSDGFSNTVIDSIAVTSENTFQKTVTLPAADLYMLNCQDAEWLQFWGEDENIEVDFRGVDTAKIRMMIPIYRHIKNSGKNNELINLLNFFNNRAYMNQIEVSQETYAAENSSSDEWKEYMKDGYKRAGDQRDAYFEYLGENYRDRNSIVAIIPYVRNKEKKADLVEYLKTTKADYPPFKAYVEEQEFKEQQEAKLEPGKQAPDFSFPVPDGTKTLGPEDYRGKILLIDFWASWCGPCRKSIPQLKELYDSYNDKGFEILSVSIDSKESAWKKAMEEEDMPWAQVLAPDAGKELTKLYQFSGIPHLVLLDREGKIIVKSLGFNEKVIKENLSDYLD